MEQKVLENKEFEFKYKIDSDKVKSLLNKVRRSFRGYSERHIDYTDTYFVKDKFEHDKYVPYCIRLRKGDEGSELTTKSLVGCGPNERNEKNKKLKDNTTSMRTLKALAYIPEVQLLKECDFITTDELWITMDKVTDSEGDEAYYFEIEVIYPTSSESATKLLTDAEALLGLTEEERIDDLLFEIYTGRRLMRSN
jgi:adenylate cyclase class IV